MEKPENYAQDIAGKRLRVTVDVVAANMDSMDWEHIVSYEVLPDPWVPPIEWDTYLDGTSTPHVMRVVDGELIALRVNVVNPNLVGLTILREVQRQEDTGSIKWLRRNGKDLI